MCSELQYSKNGTCVFKDSLTINSDLSNVYLKINRKIKNISSFPQTFHENTISYIEVSLNEPVIVSIFEETVSNEIISTKTYFDEEEMETTIRLRLPKNSQRQLYAYIYKKPVCPSKDGFQQTLISGMCQPGSKCSNGHFKHNDRCLQIGANCDDSSIMTATGNCKSSNLSCPEPDSLTQFFQSKVNDGIKECIPVCKLVSSDGFLIRKENNTCIKTKHCGENFTFYKNKCLEEGQECEPGKTIQNNTCETKQRTCPYHDADLFQSVNKDCSIQCNEMSSDHYKITQTNYKTCRKERECADGYVEHNGACISEHLGKCIVPGSFNVVTKQGKCTESHLCPKPDHLHSHFNDSCIPMCKPSYKGFKVVYDQNSNSCVKQDTCIPGFVKTENRCVKQNTDCSHLRNQLDVFSKELNGSFNVTDNGCELTCDPFHKIRRTKTIYSYDNQERKIQCKASKTECYHEHESYDKKKKMCVPDITIKVVNAGYSTLVCKFTNKQDSQGLNLGVKESSTIYIPNFLNTYIEMEDTTVPIQILFLKRNKVVQKIEQFASDRLPVDQFNNNSIIIKIFTKRKQNKQSKEIKTTAPPYIHGIYSDYLKNQL